MSKINKIKNGYNHNVAEQTFNKEWALLKAQCKSAGMSEEQIQKLYKFEREIFNSERRYFEHEVVVDIGSLSAKISLADDSLFTEDSYFKGSADWLSNIENPNLAKAVHHLSDTEKKMIIIYCKGGYTISQTEKIVGAYNGAWRLMIKKLKKEFEC